MLRNVYLCGDCANTTDCSDPFPHYECANYVHRITNWEIVDLFRGMPKEMQKSVYEIMKSTQTKKEADDENV